MTNHEHNLASTAEPAGDARALPSGLGLISLEASTVLKLREHGLVLDEDLIAQLPAERTGADVVDMAAFRRRQEWKEIRKNFQPPKPFRIEGRPMAANTSETGPLDYQRVAEARLSQQSFDELFREYEGLLRAKCNDYFVAGGEAQDLFQEASLAFYKAVRDYDGSSSFKSFLTLVTTRQIITAVKTATRFKHVPLNEYISFSMKPAGTDIGEDLTIGDALPSSRLLPEDLVISTEALQRLVFMLGSALSPLESDALRLYLEGNSYEEMAEQLDCDVKAIDNALQRVKRKIIAMQQDEDFKSPLLEGRL